MVYQKLIISVLATAGTLLIGSQFDSGAGNRKLIAAEVAAPAAGGEAARTGSNSGSISGTVRFESRYPRQKKIRVTKDFETCGGIKKSERFIVSKETKGLKNVLVRLENATGARTAPATREVTIEQKSCTYVPHFQAASIGPDGVTLKIRNNDGIFHNVHAFREGKTLFNFAQTGGQKEISRKIKEPGVIEFKCDVHAWMNGFVVLLPEGTYYAVTDAEGHFSIPDIPPGTYQITAWHEALGTMKKSVTVTNNQAATVEFIIKPRKRKKKS